MLKLSILMHKGSRLIIVVVQVKSTEKICSSSAGAQEKGRRGTLLQFLTLECLQENLQGELLSF
jgi:hypothetical protein